MKSILLKSIPFVIAFILLNVLFLNYSGFYKQQDEYVERIENVIKNQSATIFLGDSHTESIKLLDLPNNVGNLAYGADGIKEMYSKVLIMLETNKNVKTIFITVEPQMFNNSVSPNNTFLNRYLINVNDSLDVYGKSKLNILTERIPLFNDGFIKYFVNQVFDKFKSTPKKNTKNWSELTKEEQSQMALKMGALDHIGIMSRESDLEVFKEIVRICDEKGIKLIGTHFPVSKDYIGQCAPKDINKVYDFLDEMQLDQILDYTYSFQDQVYYRDQDHLNKEGMTILANYIYKDTGINILK